jgi:hypothetical protein
MAHVGKISCLVRTRIVEAVVFEMMIERYGNVAKGRKVQSVILDHSASVTKSSPEVASSNPGPSWVDSEKPEPLIASTFQPPAMKD